ncbi:MAG: SDR family NAD(P)-dependent oxidoreductase, partial [Myxococcota bacterium]
MAGKVAYMSGATSGIGLGVAKRFAEHGATVYVVSRSQDKVDEAVRMLREIGVSSAGMAVDVRNFEDVQRSVVDCAEQFGKIDFVLAAAAGNFPAPAMGMSHRAFKSVVDIDLLGTFNTLRASFEHLNMPGASAITIVAPQ